MNFLQVKIRGTTLVFDSGRSFPIPERLMEGMPVLPTVAAFGFRPEDVQSEGEGIGFSGEVLAVEALGFQSVVSIRTPEGDVRILSPRHDHEKAGSASFSVPEEKVHLFSGPGGKAWSRA